jgi:hypothetical protein
MTTKTRNWLIALFILASPFMFFLGLLLFWTAEPLPPLAPLPNPNGYEDLVKAGKFVTADAGDCDKMDEAQLRDLVGRNHEALSLARGGLSNECRVSLQFSTNYVNIHLEELTDLKKLSQAFVAEGRLAEMENRPNDAVKSYLDAIHTGIESGQGGILIDELVGIAIEARGTSSLQKLVGKLDAESCRETAATLEILDSQRQTWADILQQENAWSRRTFSSPRYRLAELMASGSAKKDAQNGVEWKFEKQQANTRQLMIALAARAYELGKGHPPASVADLVPDYLKAIPQDPVTGTNLTYSPR